VNDRLRLPLRIAAVAASTAVLGAIAAAPAAADGDVQVVNTETVQIYTSPTGEIQTQRVYEQLALRGTGSVDLRNPVSTDGLRNLQGFSGFDVEDGQQVFTTSVDGEKHLRSVSDFDGELPLDVSVAYKLDGKNVEPGDVVGSDGELEVIYTVKNVTGEPQELSFPDGKGGTVTKTVDVPVPMVGSLTTTTPSAFTNVASDQANMAGDGKGGTQLSFTMTLFPPIGSDTAVFGYTADITDGVVPRARISALPVNPLQSPTFKTAATSYKGGADTGIELTDGATQIDANLLKLRDGASDLLAGLIKLRNGAGELQAGLAGEAAPGADKLAVGASQLHTGLGLINSGSRRLAAGTSEAFAGSGELAAGADKLSAGVGELKGKLPGLSNGVGDLSDGQTKLAAGLKDLYD
jgi:putative membrane protein